MPVFEYRCNVCHTVYERLERTRATAACAHCGSPDVAKLVSRFTFKSGEPAKYSDDFREKALPFLRSRPGAAELLAEGGESEEAKAFQITEHIGQRVDSALEGL